MCNFIENFLAKAPPIFGREFVEQQTGGLIKAKTLANLDSAGKGPLSVRIGRKRAYSRDAFGEWLRRRMGA